MELNIGTNIKRLRLEKGLTQERLAELLCISTAAVSKWEAKNTYPDITMLFPLASVFGVSVDELLGYDEAKEKAEIDEMLKKYNKFHWEGRFDEANEVILAARKKYPHDYRVMREYMWHKAGGSAANYTEILLENRDELLEICDCILDGCTQEKIRIEAIEMKSKLCHAQNDTERAMKILSDLPGYSAELAKEHLFTKDTPEYTYWNKRNCYALFDAFAFKLARTVRYDGSLSLREKIAKIDAWGKVFAKMAETEGLEFFCIGERALYTAFVGLLTAEDNIGDVIYLREKSFAAMEKTMKLAETDEIIKEMLEKRYKNGDMFACEAERLLTSPHPQLASLREYPEYVEMLEKWKR